MPRNRSKSREVAGGMPGASIPEARSEAESEAGPGSAKRAKGTAVRKQARKPVSAGKARAAIKSRAVFAAEPLEVCTEGLIVMAETSGLIPDEIASGGKSSISSETSIRERIALLAYFYWETRGCPGGSSDEDWFRAEREVLEGLQSAGDNP